MHMLKRFWRSLEILPSGAGVSEQWQRLLGEEYPLTQRFFHPTGELTLAFPHRDPDRLYYRVVSHGPDDHVGVCDETGERVTLATDELVERRLDHVVVDPEVRLALGLMGDSTPTDHLYRTYRLGFYAPLAGYRFPAWLTIQASDREFQRVIHELVALEDGPLVMLAPTGRFLRPQGETSLRRRKACFVPLDEAVALGDDGQLTATPVGKDMLRSFRRQVVPEEAAPSRMEFFPTPAGATWGQVRLRLVDGHTVSIRVGAARGVFSYAQLGMVNRRSGNPSVQWELLRLFAQGGGILTWRSPGADRRNQKRRELLARGLKAFFRIEEDPFVVQGDGWRARFEIDGSP